MLVAAVVALARQVLMRHLRPAVTVALVHLQALQVQPLLVLVVAVEVALRLPVRGAAAAVALVAQVLSGQGQRQLSTRAAVAAVVAMTAALVVQAS